MDRSWGHATLFDCLPQLLILEPLRSAGYNSNNRRIIVSNKKEFIDHEVGIKQKISGLWVSMLFVFVYVDIFGFYRADILKSALVGKVGDFAASQTFFALTTLYILIPCLMVFLSLVMKPRLNRIINLVVAPAYILTIIGASLGEEWKYFLIGSFIEVVLLGLIINYCWKWPRNI